MNPSASTGHHTEPPGGSPPARGETEGERRGRQQRRRGHGAHGGHPQGTVDRSIRRPPGRLVVDRPALRHGGGLLLHDRHPRRPAAAAGRRLVELARPAGLALRRPRRELAGDARTAPYGSRRAPTPPWRGSGSWCPGAEDGVVFAGTEPGAVFRSTDGGETFALERGAVGPPAPPAVERRVRRPGLPHRAAAPHRPAVGHRRAVHRRRLPDHRRRGLLGAAQPGHPGRVPARGPAVPRVRPVRAQGGPAPRPRPSGCSSRTTAASTAPTTRAARGSTIADGLPADFGFPIVVHPHEPDTVFVFPIKGGDARYPQDAKALRLALRRRRGDLGGAAATGLPDTFFVGVMRDAMCRRPARPGRALLRRPQRRRLRLLRRGGHLARGGPRPARRDGGAGRGALTPLRGPGLLRIASGDTRDQAGCGATPSRRFVMGGFAVSRSTTVIADPAQVHALINDFHEWTAWSPWEDLDPELQRDYTGPDERRRRALRVEGQPQGRAGLDGDHVVHPGRDRDPARVPQAVQVQQRRHVLAGPGRRRHRGHLADDRRAAWPDGPRSAGWCRWTGWSARTSRRA